MDENQTRDLIVATIVRFGLTTLLCSFPFMKLGVNPVSAGFAMLIFAPCSLMLSRPIIEWLGVYASYVKRQPYAAWQGNYYEFAGSHIRIYCVNRSIWFNDRDVLKVIGQKRSANLKASFDVLEYDSIPSTWQYGFSEEGVEKLLQSSSHRESKRMLQWIQREVVKPFHRALELNR